MPEGEGWARNSGVWIKIRTDNSKSHDDEKQETAKAKNSADTFPRWTQPQQANRMVKLWLSNAKDRVSGQDPLDVFLSNDKWIPDIEWLKHVMPTIDEQHEGIQWLHEMIGEYTMGATGSRLQNMNPRMLKGTQKKERKRSSENYPPKTQWDGRNVRTLNGTRPIITLRCFACAGAHECTPVRN